MIHASLCSLFDSMLETRKTKRKKMTIVRSSMKMKMMKRKMKKIFFLLNAFLSGGPFPNKLAGWK